MREGRNLLYLCECLQDRLCTDLVLMGYQTQPFSQWEPLGRQREIIPLVLQIGVNLLTQTDFSSITLWLKLTQALNR